MYIQQTAGQHQVAYLIETAERAAESKSLGKQAREHGHVQAALCDASRQKILMCLLGSLQSCDLTKLLAHFFVLNLYDIHLQPITPSTMSRPVLLPFQ